MRAAALVVVAALAAACGGPGSQGPHAPIAPAPASRPAGPAAPVPLEKLEGKLVSVEVAGLTGKPAQAARAAVKSAVGQALDRAQVARDLAALWALGGVAGVVAKARPQAGGVALRFVVTPQPVLRSVDVRGSHAVSATQWLRTIGIKTGDVYDPVKTLKVRNHMIDRFHQMGYMAVQVEVRVHRAKDGQVDLALVVEEGPQVRISHLEFRGNKAVSDKTLLGILVQHGGITVGKRYWRRALENALLHVTAHYYDHGYIDSHVGPPQEKLAADRESVAVVVPVSEGAQFRLGTVKVEGALVAPARQYLKLLALRRGQVFSRKKVTDGIQRITEMARKKGQASPAVTPVTNVDPDKHRVDLTFEISAGG